MRNYQEKSENYVSTTFVYGNSCIFVAQMKTSLSKRLTYRIMTVVLVMMAVIAGVVYFTVREYMLDEAKERYQNILLENRQELRRRLSDVYVAAENNVHDSARLQTTNIFKSS